MAARPMTLRARRCLFTFNLARLIAWVNMQKGYTCSLSEALRPQWVAEKYAKEGKGSRVSLHIDGLAVDLNIYSEGVYLTKSEDYEFAGAYWKTLDPDNRWGGDIESLRDGNHFSCSPDKRI